MTDRLDVIAAFADGEPVAAPELDAALADADGRAYLIDLLALRGLIDGQRVDAQRTPVARALQSPLKKMRSLAAIAALILAGIAGGYLTGRQTVTPGQDRVERPMTSAAPSTAPAPTHVIRIENGVNWNERAGGN